MRTLTKCTRDLSLREKHKGWIYTDEGCSFAAQGCILGLHDTFPPRPLLTRPMVQIAPTLSQLSICQKVQEAGSGHLVRWGASKYIQKRNQQRKQFSLSFSLSVSLSISLYVYASFHKPSGKVKHMRSSFCARIGKRCSGSPLRTATSISRYVMKLTHNVKESGTTPSTLPRRFILSSNSAESWSPSIRYEAASNCLANSQWTEEGVTGTFCPACSQDIWKDLTGQP